jgi:hypothetical protein
VDEGKRMERGERAVPSYRWGERHDEEVDAARRVAVERGMDHTQIADLGRRRTVAWSGVRIRNDAEVTVGVQQGTVLGEEQHDRE